MGTAKSKIIPSARIKTMKDFGVLTEQAKETPSFENIKKLSPNDRVHQVVGKVVKLMTPRKVGSGTVANLQLKDLSGDILTVAIWDELVPKVAVDMILQLSNLRVDKYPVNKPHYLKSTAATQLKNQTAELQEKYSDISLSDGKLSGVVECFFDVYTYTSCSSCNCKQEKNFCTRCNKTGQPMNDFKYEVMFK